MTPMQQQLPMYAIRACSFPSPSPPHLLLPSGAHVSAVLEMLSRLYLNTCPNHRHLFTRVRTDTGVLSVAWHSSSLILTGPESSHACTVKHIQFVEISCCHPPHFDYPLNRVKIILSSNILLYIKHILHRFARRAQRLHLIFREVTVSVKATKRVPKCTKEDLANQFFSLWYST